MFNPVSKHAHKSNKSVVFTDRKKAVKNGKVKHKKDYKNAGIE